MPHYLRMMVVAAGSCQVNSVVPGQRQGGSQDGDGNSSCVSWREGKCCHLGLKCSLVLEKTIMYSTCVMYGHIFSWWEVSH